MWWYNEVPQASSSLRNNVCARCVLSSTVPVLLPSPPSAVTEGGRYTLRLLRYMYLEILHLAAPNTTAGMDSAHTSPLITFCGKLEKSRKVLGVESFVYLHCFMTSASFQWMLPSANPEVLFGSIKGSFVFEDIQSISMTDKSHLVIRLSSNDSHEFRCPQVRPVLPPPRAATRLNSPVEERTDKQAWTQN